MMLTTQDRKEIVDKLRDVIDPELGVNIIDLGLVYNIYSEDEKLVVEYTVTTPGCPMRRLLQQLIEEALESIEMFQDYEARLVWEPEWSINMLNPDLEFFA